MIEPLIVIFLCTFFHKKQREMLIKQSTQQAYESTMKIYRFKKQGLHSCEN
jgi:hypothetical protein